MEEGRENKTRPPVVNNVFHTMGI